MKHIGLIFFLATASFATHARSKNAPNAFNKTSFTEKHFTLNCPFKGYSPDMAKLPDTIGIRPPIEATGNKFLEELIRPYKGKVVYIDFWAPWCGPCMGEMPDSKERMHELKGKDIVFLYIAISCTKQSWENTIKEKELEGEHYYANKEEGALLSNKFNFSGIPFYVLVDKTGKVKINDAPRPSDKAKLMKKINELLK